MKYRIVKVSGQGFKAQVQVVWWLDLHETYMLTEEGAQEMINDHKRASGPLQVVHEEEG